MRKAARAIVIKDNRLLIMRRNKFGEEYCALIGGSIKIGETEEEALRRELREEASIEVTNPRLVIIEQAGAMYGTQYIYTCDYESGEVSLSPDSEEAKISALGRNLYQPVWLPLSDLQDANLLPKELKEVLLENIDKGFPTDPILLTVRD